MKKYFPALFLLSSCILFRGKHDVLVTNNTNVTIDSVNVNVSNRYKIKLNAIPAGTRATETFVGVSLGHDIVYHVGVFVKDSLVSRKSFFSNDLGSIPREFGVIITRDFKLELDTMLAY